MTGTELQQQRRAAHDVKGRIACFSPARPPHSGSFDEECRALVAENLQKRGVHCHPGCNPTRCAALLRCAVPLCAMLCHAALCCALLPHALHMRHAITRCAVLLPCLTEAEMAGREAGGAGHLGALSGPQPISGHRQSMPGGTAAQHAPGLRLGSRPHSLALRALLPTAALPAAQRGEARGRQLHAPLHRQGQGAG